MNYTGRIAQSLVKEWWQKLLFFLIFSSMSYIAIYSPINSWIGYNYYLSPLFLLFLIVLPLIIIEVYSPNSRWYFIGFFRNNEEGKNIFWSIVITLSVFIVYSYALIIYGSRVSFFQYFEIWGVMKICYNLLIFAVIEELIFRGAILNYLNRRFSQFLSVMIVSLSFTVSHLMNPDINFLAVFNIFIMSAVLSMIYVRTHSLLIVILIHSLWNMYQALILGWNVSGINFYYSISQFSKINLPEYLTGGYFGIEASIVATFLILLSGLAYFKVLKINPEVSALLFYRDYGAEKI